MSARDNILARIRGALDRKQPLTDTEAAKMRSKLREHPRGPMPAMDWDPLVRFPQRCLSLSSTVDTIASLEQLPAAVARYLETNQLTRTAVCWPQYAGLDWSGSALDVEPRAATGDDLTGITGSYCAIAETGTLMLLSGTDTHSKTSLLPETHIAVVARSRIVRSMEDAWDLLRREHRQPPRQVAFVSGPSRTADIELTLVLGVHGPYRVHVILLDDIGSDAAGEPIRTQ